MFAEVTWVSTRLAISCRSLLRTQLSLPLSTEALSKLLPGPGPLLLPPLVTLLMEDFASHLLYEKNRKELDWTANLSLRLASPCQDLTYTSLISKK